MPVKLLLDLPNELVVDIAGFLDPESALRFAACSKQVRQLLSHDCFWRQLLFANGFGVPISRQGITFKQYLLHILLHCRNCQLCRFDWTRKIESTDLPLPAVNKVIRAFSECVPYPAAAFYEGIHNPSSLNTTLRSVHCVLEYRTSLLVKPLLLLRDHSIYEGALLAEKAIFKLKWSIERRYIVQEASGQKMYPLVGQSWNPMDLHVEVLKGGELANPCEITVDDMLAALKTKTEDKAFLAGPIALQYCEMRTPRHLVLVLGSYHRVYT